MELEPKLTVVASPPSPYPNSAAPEAHEESSKPIPVQAVPWFEPLSRYFHESESVINSSEIGGEPPESVILKSKLTSELVDEFWCISTAMTLVPTIKLLVIVLVCQSLPSSGTCVVAVVL